MNINLNSSFNAGEVYNRIKAHNDAQNAKVAKQTKEERSAKKAKKANKKLDKLIGKARKASAKAAKKADKAAVKVAKAGAGATAASLDLAAGTWLPVSPKLAEKITEQLQAEAGQSEADLLAAHIAKSASTATEISKGITMSTAEGPNGIMDVNIIVDSALNRAPDSAMAQALDAARNGPRGGQNQGRGQNQSRGQNRSRGARIERQDHEEK